LNNQSGFYLFKDNRSKSNLTVDMTPLKSSLLYRVAYVGCWNIEEHVCDCDCDIDCDSNVVYLLHCLVYR